MYALLNTVEPGTRAIVFDKTRGDALSVTGEGTHFKIPFFQIPIMMDIRSRPRSIHSSTGTKDAQQVNISLRVLSRPDEEKLQLLYRMSGLDFDDRVLPSICNEVLKAVVSQYIAEELLTKRNQVSNKIKILLAERCKKFNIIMDDVSITHLAFGREFARAIEEKQVAQQEAETAYYRVLKDDQERKAMIIRAEGDAEAADLINKAMVIGGTGLIEVRRIAAAKEIATTLSKARNVTYLPNTQGGGGGGGGGLLLNLNDK